MKHGNLSTLDLELNAWDRNLISADSPARITFVMWRKLHYLILQLVETKEPLYTPSEEILEVLEDLVVGNAYKLFDRETPSCIIDLWLSERANAIASSYMGRRESIFREMLNHLNTNPALWKHNFGWQRGVAYALYTYYTGDFLRFGEDRDGSPISLINILLEGWEMSCNDVVEYKTSSTGAVSCEVIGRYGEK